MYAHPKTEAAHPSQLFCILRAHRRSAQSRKQRGRRCQTTQLTAEHLPAIPGQNELVIFLPAWNFVPAQRPRAGLAGISRRRRVRLVVRVRMQPRLELLQGMQNIVRRCRGCLCGGGVPRSQVLWHGRAKESLGGRGLQTIGVMAYGEQRSCHVQRGVTE